MQVDDNNLNIGDTRLMHAIITDDLVKTKALISKGLQINEMNYLGKTALHIAVEKQNVDAVELLLNQRDINVNAALLEGFTPLMLACMIKHTNKRIIQMLLQHGSNLQATTFNSERSAIHYAAKDCSLDIIQLLIEGGADINAQDENKNTALHIAMERRDVEIIAMLLYYNADTSILNMYGPPLQEAKTPEIRELMLPYTDMCNEDVLYQLDTRTMLLLWNFYESKRVFAQWLLDDIQTRMRYLFIAFKVSPREMCQFLHELYEDDDMHEVMYQAETSKCLLELIPSRTVNLHQDGVTADMFRLLLSNCNELKMGTLNRLLHVSDFSPAIIRVLEDLDVIIMDDLQQQKAQYRMAEPIPWPLLWKMYCTPRIDLEDELLRYSQNSIAQKFYAIGRAPSLLELCRNKIRDDVMTKYSTIAPNRPFHYAAILKPLPVPSVMIDVLLLRKPLY